MYSTRAINISKHQWYEVQRASDLSEVSIHQSKKTCLTLLASLQFTSFTIIYENFSYVMHSFLDIMNQISVYPVLLK